MEVVVSILVVSILVVVVVGALELLDLGANMADDIMFNKELTWK